MEHVIKIPSQQSAFSPLNNLADLVIPGSSGIYDLSQTYIAFDTSLKNPSWPPLPVFEFSLISQTHRLNFKKNQLGRYKHENCTFLLETMRTSMPQVTEQKLSVKSLL